MLPKAAPLLIWAVLASIPRLAFPQSCALEPPAFAGHAFPPDGSPLDPGDFRLVNAFPELTFTRPVFLTFSPDGSGRLFVVEQAGRILVFPNDPGATSAALFLDITDQVESAGLEQGLLGLAFDPGHASNGFFYVNYTAPAANCVGGGLGCTKVVRYRVAEGDPDQADPVTALELLEFAQPGEVHKGGMLAFGPDGMLYIASGDGGSYRDSNGQDLTTRLGKILRIDPHAAAPHIPPGNPFATDPDRAREIWHYGLRNPWRFSFDRVTGDLWIGDVGESSWEEIDFFPAGHAGGANLGWGICEGNHDYSGNCAALGATPPVLEYDHSSGMGNVVIGGYAYRGSAAPALTGAYVFGDGSSGRIFAWNRVASPVDVGNLPDLSSFGEDEQGEIYALGLFSGSIYRIEQDLGGGGDAFPVLLSQTGLFSDVGSLTPAPGMVEYSVAVPFWSDNASKRRWIALPEGARVDFDADDAWDPPAGTALVKHFEVPTGPGQTRRLETRVLLHQTAGQSAPARWVGFTYRWNASQSDAELLTAGLDEQVSVDLGSGPELQDYHYPAAWECLQCHNGAAGDVLGLRTAQMNLSFPYPGGMANQLATWSCAGMLDETVGDPVGYETLVDPADAGAALTPRARSWLDVNCSMCHRPAGPAPGGMDLTRYPLLGGMNAIDVLPTQGNLGIANARRIFPGSKEQSVLWARVQSSQLGVHMPPQSRAADPLGVSLLGEWIDTAMTLLDSDTDGSDDSDDNCPYVANDQSDVGGIGDGSPPDGRGDACQCGDLFADGRVTSDDALELRRNLTGQEFPPDLMLCNVFDPANAPKGDCDLVDAVAISRALAGASPAVAPLCRAAGAAP